LDVLRVAVWSRRSSWLFCLALAVLGCGGKKGSSVASQSTFDATFSSAAGTNATTSELDLVFETKGPNPTVTASAAYLVFNGVGGMTIIWEDAGPPDRKVDIYTTGTPAAGVVYDTDATQPYGDDTLTYKEGDQLWDGTGTITIQSVDHTSTLLDFTASMAMQPDATSPGGATGVFNLDITSSTTVFGL